MKQKDDYLLVDKDDCKEAERLLQSKNVNYDVDKDVPNYANKVEFIVDSKVVNLVVSILDYHNGIKVEFNPDRPMSFAAGVGEINRDDDAIGIRDLLANYHTYYAMISCDGFVKEVVDNKSDGFKSEWKKRQKIVDYVINDQDFGLKPVNNFIADLLRRYVDSMGCVNYTVLNFEDLYDGSAGISDLIKHDKKLTKLCDNYTGNMGKLTSDVTTYHQCDEIVFEAIKKKIIKLLKKNKELDVTALGKNKLGIMYLGSDK